jgi:NitT/TauT family transport system permease protein
MMIARLLAPYGPRSGARTRVRFAWWIDALLLVAVAALIAGIVAAARRWTAPLSPHPEISLAPSALPVYAGLSTLRMAIAYVGSVVFSLVYARIAAASRRAERVLIPLLDILQSIPILSFMPGVVLGLVALFPRSNVGLELAAVLLIFTSQAWNLAFGFYQSLVGIPKDLREAATITHLNGWQRFTRLELPCGMIPLIWNSMMSWAGGWFFLMAAEQFTLGDKQFQLPGLGSYLQAAANADDVGALLLGLLALVSVVVLLDQLLWRPLVAWSERFKAEQTEAAALATSPVLTALRRSALIDRVHARTLAPVGGALDRLSLRLSAAAEPRGAPPGKASGAVGASTIVGLVVLLLVVAGTVVGAVAAAQLLIQLSASDWEALGIGAAATLARTAVAVAIGAAWTVPAGVAIGLNRRLAPRVQPLVQLVASIPATALFQALLLVLLGLPGGLNVAAIALMLLGTQWYILFNVIAGAMAIPTELQEAATVFRLSGLRRWRSLILPAIFPSLVTGMLTATGGAWNASIVSEYVSFGGQKYRTVGLGAEIAAAADAGNFALLLAATLVMALVVVVINRLWWRRLQATAVRRYQLEG